MPVKCKECKIKYVVYNYEGNKAMYCGDCKLENINKKCEKSDQHLITKDKNQCIVTNIKKKI